MNEVSPTRAFVHNDGKWVVTVDEFRVGGARHAVAIYDQHGKLKHEFGLRDLLTRRDWTHVRARGKSVEWLPGAKFAFADEPARFIIDLKWDRKITIDLEQAKASDADSESGAEPDSPDAGIPADLLAVLNGAHEDGANDSDGAPDSEFDLDAIRALLARAAEGEALSPEELEQLAAALLRAGADLSVDEAMQIAGVLERATNETGFELPKEIEQQIVERWLASPEFADGLGKSIFESEDFKSGLAEAIINSDGFKQALGKAISGAAKIDSAGNSAAAGLPIPNPNPAAPIDYIAWMNKQAETEGPNAAPAYRAALDKLVKWEGGDERMAAALRGDPDALRSPEIKAWLDANAAALDGVKQANGLEYRGMQMSSPDGTMLGILLPHAAEMRETGRMMIMRGQQLELEGNSAEAMNYYLQGTKLGAQASHGPTLIENLVGQAVQSASSETLLDAMARDNGSLDYASIAERLEREYPPARPVSESFQMERTFVLDLIQSAYEYNADANTYRVSDAGPKKLATSLTFMTDKSDALDEAALGIYLGATGFENLARRANDYYDTITEAAMAPYGPGREQFRQVESSIDNPMFRATEPILSRLLPAVSRASELSTRNEAQRRATRLTANLKAYKQQTGSYPDSLDAIGERNFAVDPYSGERFVYRRNGDDFTLYSLGSNMSDDGGVHDPKKNTNDIVYWPRPPK